MLNIQNVIKSYEKNLVLNGVSFTAGNGDKIAVVGLNGAGKSTLLNIIAGTLEFNEGQISGAHNIGFMQQTIGEMNLPENMSVLDFIDSVRPIKNSRRKK